MKIVLRIRDTNTNSYKYITDENGITIKKFGSRKEALQFLKCTIPKEKFSLSGWECITLHQFKEELNDNYVSFYSAVSDTRLFA